MRPTVPATPYFQGGAGEPTVLLHGFTDTWRAWLPVIPYLEPTRTVFAPALPGHYGGESFGAEKMTIPGSLDRLERLLDSHGIGQAHLVGSSLGGWASLELAARGRALSVVGVCPAGGWVHGSREGASVIRYFRKTDRLLRASKSSLHLVARSPLARRFALRELIADPSKVTEEQAYAMFVGAAGCDVTRDALELAEAEETFPMLTGIDVPVRILYGTRDRIIRWPSHYPRLRQMLPDAEFVALEGMGHLPMFDNAELVAEHILAPITRPMASVALP